jgi:tetratricopeptide (TPR) repeat protein
MEQSPGTSVFWVYASNAARFEEAYKRIALECQVPGRDDPKPDLMQLVRNWLESRYECRWLMVIDNVDEASVFFKEKNSFGKSLSEYVPQSSKGSILYTTRDRDVGVDLTPDDRDPIIVPSMNFEEARTLLGEKISCESTEAEQLELLEGLDYLPLAITQAAAFIAKRRQTMAQYLNLYRHSDPTRIRLLSHKFTDHGREARPMESVATTWMISFECIKKQSPRAADILSLMSFLDQQDIPKSLLVGEKEDPLDFSEAIDMLDAMSLISTNRQRDSYKMHRLVQLATRAWLSECDNGVERLASQALEILAANFPNGGYEHWTTCAAYLPHAEAVLSHRFGESSGTNKTARATLLLNTSRYFRGQGRFEAAEARAEKSFCLRKEMLGTEHPETLTCLSTLASVFQYRGKYEAAEKMGRQALKGRKKTLGMEHPDTLASISDLAFVLRHRGKYEEAEEMNRRALEGRENTLGEEHLDTLASVSYLAEVLRNQGKYEDAGRMERRALEGRRNILGEEHPDTLISLSNLAEILTSQGEYGTAEEKHRRALKGREKTLGKEHPTTLISVSNLALVLQPVIATVGNIPY